MSRTKLSIALAALLLAFGFTGGAGWWLRGRNAALRAELGAPERPVVTPLPAVPAAPVAPASATVQTPGPQREQLQEALAALRSQVAELETRAAKQKAELLAQQARDLELMETNFDAANGMVRLERLRDRGQDTPAAAMETLLWAAGKGDVDTLKRLFVLSERGVERAKVLQERLPRSSADEWSVEAIGALYVMDLATQIAAVEIANETIVSPGHATVDLRMVNGLRLPGVQVRRSDNGWKVVLPEYATTVLEQRLQRGPSI